MQNIFSYINKIIHLLKSFFIISNTFILFCKQNCYKTFKSNRFSHKFIIYENILTKNTGKIPNISGYPDK